MSPTADQIRAIVREHRARLDEIENRPDPVPGDPGMPSVRHARLVAALVAEGADVYAFSRELRGVMSTLPAIDVRPDAFILDDFAARATAFEVVVANRIDRQKRGKYDRLRMEMLARGWALDVVTIDAEGRRKELW